MTALSLGLLLLGSCAAPPTDPIQKTFGPTTVAHPDRTYTLTNRRLTLTIDPTTGAASLHAKSSPAGEMILPSFTALPNDAPATGYLESRDEETWQYIGESSDGRVGWRIVYSLYYNAVNVTYLVQNKSAAAITGHVELPLPSGVAIQAFNENPDLNGPSTKNLRGDDRTLQPNERINFATRWTIG